jgi:uncharacterized membrane protein YeiH
LATAIFAVTGVLAAARQNMDVLSFLIIGVVTALGGGTLRDLTLGTRVFWLDQPVFLYVAAAAAIAKARRRNGRRSAKSRSSRNQRDFP